MRKRRIQFLIPVIIIIGLLLYTWYCVLVESYIIQIRQYLGLILFIPVLYCWYKDKTLAKPIVATGIYLVLATVNILSYLPYYETSSYTLTIGSIELYTPGLSASGLILLILYAILNTGNLMEIHLDYKESKGKH